MRVRRVTDGELAALFATPGRDALDTLDEPAAIVTTFDGTPTGDDALAALASWPCIVVGVGHDPDSAPAHVDVVVEPDVADLDAVLATVDASPIAATTLALVLRGTPHRSLGEGLVAESAAYSVLQSGPEFRAWRARTTRRDRRPDDGPAVRVQRRGELLEVVLSRPHVRNALNRAMRDQLLEALELAVVDGTVERVDIRGEGPSFCAGGDLDEFGTFDDPASAHLVRLATSVGRAIATVASRVTCHLHGACAGSGVELPAFAGTVVADPATTFALPELELGLIPGAGGTVSLTRRIGRHRVALLALCGRAIDAPTARRWGLVDAIEPRAEPANGATEWSR